MINKPDKKSLIYLGIVAIAALICVALVYELSQQTKKINIINMPTPLERTQREIINDLTAPASSKIEPVSPQTIKDLTAPKAGEKAISTLSEKVIQDLTAPKK